MWGGGILGEAAMEAEPLMDCYEPEQMVYHAVHLRLSGLSSGVVVKVETATVAAVQVSAQPQAVHDLKRKVWHLSREKGAVLRRCDQTVRELTNKIKEKSRDALRELQTATRNVDEMNQELKRAKSDSKYYRSRMHKFQEQNKELIHELKEAVQLSKDSKREATRALAKERAATTKCTSATEAYRKRATEVMQLSKERKAGAEEISFLKTVAVEAEEEAAAQREKASTILERLEESEERMKHLDGEYESMRRDLAERQVEQAAHSIVGEHLHETNQQLASALETKDCALEVARKKIENLRELVTKLQPPSQATSSYQAR